MTRIRLVLLAVLISLAPAAFVYVQLSSSAPTPSASSTSTPSCLSARATVTRTLDGDTFEADVAVWVSPISGRALVVPDRIRLLGVNAPERKGLTKEAGDRTRAFVDAWLRRGPFELTNCGAQRDSFGRALAAVTRDAENLADLLLQHDPPLAVPFVPR